MIGPSEFWLDGLPRQKFQISRHQLQTKKHQSWRLQWFNERSNCQIAELLLFDQVLSAEDRVH